MTVKKIIRPEKGRVVAGVAAAFAKYFNIDITIVRIIWIMFFIPGGLPGHVPYLICWMVIPSEK